MLALSACDGDLNSLISETHSTSCVGTEQTPVTLQQLSDWIELNPDPMACVDAGGAIRLTNGAFRRMFEADEPGAPPRLQRFLPWLGATTLHHILTTDDSKICDQPRDPLVMEGRIAGQRALIRVQIQRLSAFDTTDSQTACVVALRAIHPGTANSVITDRMRRQTGHGLLSSTTLTDLIDATLNRLPAAQRRRCELSEPPPQLTLAVAPNVVRDALLMLISLTCSRAPRPSRVRIVTRHDHADDAQWAVITIADRGAGLRRRDVQRLFQPIIDHSTPSQADGYGPALRLARRITESQGGWLEIRSALGIGTEVDVWLPTALTLDA